MEWPIQGGGEIAEAVYRLQHSCFSRKRPVVYTLQPAKTVLSCDETTQSVGATPTVSHRQALQWRLTWNKCVTMDSLVLWQLTRGRPQLREELGHRLQEKLPHWLPCFPCPELQLGHAKHLLKQCVQCHHTTRYNPPYSLTHPFTDTHYATEYLQCACSQQQHTEFGTNC